MIRIPALAVLGFALLASPALAGERAAADVACEPTAEALVYSCTIAVTGRKSAEPVTAKALSVKADMPSMAMAHNLPPASATPVEGKPGHYIATLELEMHGEWALAIEVNGKTAETAARVRDKVIVKQHFAPGHAGAPKQ
ncbi:MAG: FixH family protein [Alphaproteobacteria bacterium]|nr:FixH family protein [Alphaproteobacteria bacterium]MCY3752790.1 FixH family protein [Alphaproteobacteria bacterium]